MGRYVSDQRNLSDEILGIIIPAGNEGVSQKIVLSAITDVHRSTVYRIAKKLERKGQIKIITEGRTTMYVTANQQLYKDVNLAAFIVGGSAGRELIEKQVPVIHNEKFIYPAVEYNNKRYFEAKFSEGQEDIECFLFERSVRIGAFIIYSIIQAMHPNNKLTNSTKEYAIDEKQRDRLIQEWIRHALSSIQPFILKEFKKTLDIITGQYPRSYDAHVEYLKKRPHYILDKETANMLTEAFARVYPSINRRLDQIISNLHHELKTEKEFVNRVLHERPKQQEGCQHEYGKRTITSDGYYGRICSKCQKVEREQRKPATANSRRKM